MNIFWSEEKAKRYLSGVLYSVAALTDDLDHLASLVPTETLDEANFRLTLKKLHWSPRRIRNAVDTIRYGKIGARLAFRGRRFRKNNRYTLMLGTGIVAVTSIIGFFPWLISFIFLGYVVYLLGGYHNRPTLLLRSSSDWNRSLNPRPKQLPPHRTNRKKKSKGRRRN